MENQFFFFRKIHKKKAAAFLGTEHRHIIMNERQNWIWCISKNVFFYKATDVSFWMNNSKCYDSLV